MTPEAQLAIARFLHSKYKLLLEGGTSPYSIRFHEYLDRQKFVLGIFGLRDSPENVKLLNFPLFGFDIDEEPILKIENNLPPYEDNSLKSKLQMQGNWYLSNVSRARIRSMDKQAEIIFNRLHEKANCLYGCDEPD